MTSKLNLGLKRKISMQITSHQTSTSIQQDVQVLWIQAKRRKHLAGSRLLGRKLSARLSNSTRLLWPVESSIPRETRSSKSRQCSSTPMTNCISTTLLKRPTISISVTSNRTMSFEQVVYRNEFHTLYPSRLSFI